MLTVDTDEQTEFEISFAEKTEWIVGRSADQEPYPDIDLGQDSITLGVSRHHFALRLHENSISIVDLQSTNRTYLNGQQLIPENPRLVRDGDQVRAAQLRLKVDFRN